MILFTGTEIYMRNIKMSSTLSCEKSVYMPEGNTISLLVQVIWINLKIG